MSFDYIIIEVKFVIVKIFGESMRGSWVKPSNFGFVVEFLYFSENLCSHYFCDFQKDPNSKVAGFLIFGLNITKMNGPSVW